MQGWCFMWPWSWSWSRCFSNPWSRSYMSRWFFGVSWTWSGASEPASDHREPGIHTLCRPHNESSNFADRVSPSKTPAVVTTPPPARLPMLSLPRHKRPPTLPLPHTPLQLMPLPHTPLPHTPLPPMTPQHPRMSMALRWPPYLQAMTHRNLLVMSQLGLHTNVSREL